MADVRAISAVGRGNTSTKKTAPQRDNVYTVKSGDNLTQISKKFGMTPNEFKAWTGLTSDTLSINQKINLPQSKVPESKGIMTLASKYNMDFEAFCRLNNIPKPYKQYVAGKDEMFYVFKDYGKNATSPKKAEETPKPQNIDGQKPKPPSSTTKTQKYTVPKCGYISVASNETHNVKTITGKPPIPVVMEGKKERIVAEVIRFEPSKNNTGELKGKVIMVNAGHGYHDGYYDKNTVPAFDPGKSDAKDANGKQIEEWRKNRDYAEDLINSLRAKGATVIFTTGDAKLACNAKKKHKCDLFISLHCNAVKNKQKNGIEVFYHDSDNTSHNYAKKAAAKFGLPAENIKSDATTRFGQLGVLTNIGPTYVPSILFEMGYMTNAKDIANIDSWSMRKQQTDKITEFVIDMLNPPKPKKK